MTGDAGTQGTSIISPLAPIASVVVSAVIIYIKSPTNLYETNPCLYLLTFGLVIAKVTNKLVVSLLCKHAQHEACKMLTCSLSLSLLVRHMLTQVAHMTKHEVKTLDSILVGPAMLILNQYFNTFLSEYLVLWLALVRIANFRPETKAHCVPLCLFPPSFLLMSGP